MEPTIQYNSKQKEAMLLIGLFILAAILLKIVFYHETIGIILKTTMTFFWLFILPGYAITLIWQKESDLTERIIIGIPISTAILGITSYYLGLFGLNLKIQSWILPPLIIMIALIKEHYHKNKQ